jgi:hypothetical protein
MAATLHSPLVGEDEDWPPRAARIQGELWEAERRLRDREYAQAVACLERLLGAEGEDGELREVVRGLYHLAAAGYRHAHGEPDRARRQLETARRRLAPFLPALFQVELGELLDAVARDLGIAHE